jgi:hypothetical protein
MAKVCWKLLFSISNTGTNYCRLGSIYVAEEIKTLDLSLPSYDSINSLKSSAATERGLGVENPTLPEEKKARTKPARRSENQNSGNGNPLGAVLPSMNKSVAKKSTPKVNNETTARTEKASSSLFGGKDDEIKTMDLSLPSYVDGTKSKERGMFSL